MRIAIIGAGWVGTKLAAHFSQKDEHVIATTTTPNKINSLKKIATEVHLLDFGSNPDFSILDAVDVAIFSMPISHSEWHEGFEKMETKFPKTLLFSSTGIYSQEKKVHTEEETMDLRKDIVASENIVTTKYPQTNILRFGGLMGAERSVQNFFKNREPENPQKAANYIHYEDINAVVELFISSEIKGRIYNIVAPEHPTIAEILNPQQNASDTSTDHQRIISSEKLMDDFNYQFKHPNPKYF